MTRGVKHTANKGKSMLLQNIPEDVRKALLIKQAEIKAKIGHNRYSIECTVYAIIREWKKTQTT